MSDRKKYKSGGWEVGGVGGGMVITKGVVGWEGRGGGEGEIGGGEGGGGRGCGGGGMLVGG